MGIIYAPESMEKTATEVERRSLFLLDLDFMVCSIVSFSPWFFSHSIVSVISLSSIKTAGSEASPSEWDAASASFAS